MLIFKPFVRFKQTFATNSRFSKALTYVFRFTDNSFSEKMATTHIRGHLTYNIPSQKCHPVPTASYQCIANALCLEYFNRKKKT